MPHVCHDAGQPRSAATLTFRSPMDPSRPPANLPRRDHCTCPTEPSEFRRHTALGVLETGSAKTGSATDVRIDDAGSILKFRIGFSPRLSAVASHLRLSLLFGFGGVEAVDTEFPYRVPIVDRGQLPYPCLPTPFPILRSKGGMGCQGQFWGRRFTP